MRKDTSENKLDNRLFPGSVEHQPSLSTTSILVFDVANTVEKVETNEQQQIQACVEILDLLNSGNLMIEVDAESFRKVLRYRFRRLHSWRLINLIEPSPGVMWREWLLPEYSQEIVDAIAEKLTHIWMGKWYNRTFLPESKFVFNELKQKGYQIACISNTLSTSFTIDSLRRYGIYDFFETIVLSSDTGFRKPHRIMFDRVVSELGMPPESMCYIGDQLSRDVVGSINAGYGLTILVGEKSPGSWHDNATIWPDLRIARLSELLLHV